MNTSHLIRSLTVTLFVALTLVGCNEYDIFEFGEQEGSAGETLESDSHTLPDQPFENDGESPGANDHDGDGYTADEDCDDDDPDVNPGAYDDNCDDIDDDCDGLADQDGACHCFAYTEQGADYLFCEDSLDWNEAEADCEYFGGHLLTISTEEENDWAVSVALDLDFGDGGYPAWIGLHDQDEEGVFSWTSGEAVDLSLWFAGGDGEPNDGGRDDLTEDCTAFVPDGSWNDLPCEELRPYVCEM